MQYKSIRIIEDGTQPDVFSTFDQPDIGQFLLSHLGTWEPQNRIYHGTVISVATDITPMPGDELALENLEKYDQITVVLYPGEPGVALFIVTLIISLAASYFLMPDIPNLDDLLGDGAEAQSPNNRLSKRTNKARYKKRVPDIAGTVRSYPDSISIPYSKYTNFKQTEFWQGCIGRGNFDVSAADIYEGETAVADIDGFACEVIGTAGTFRSVVPLVPTRAVVGELIEELPYFAHQLGTVTGQAITESNIKHGTHKWEVPIQANHKFLQSDPDLIGVQFNFEPLTFGFLDLVTMQVQVKDFIYLYRALNNGGAGGGTITDEGIFNQDLTNRAGWVADFKNQIGNTVYITGTESSSGSVNTMRVTANRSKVHTHNLTLFSKDTVATKQMTALIASALGEPLNIDGYHYRSGDRVLMSGTYQWTHPVDGLITFDYSGNHLIEIIDSLGNMKMTVPDSWNVYTDSGSPGRFPSIETSFVLAAETVTITNSLYVMNFNGAYKVILVDDGETTSRMVLEQDVIPFNTEGYDFILLDSVVSYTVSDLTPPADYLGNITQTSHTNTPHFAAGTIGLDEFPGRVDLGNFLIKPNTDPADSNADHIEIHSQIVVNIAARSGLFKRDKDGNETALTSVFTLDLFNSDNNHVITKTFTEDDVRGSVDFKNNIKWSLIWEISDGEGEVQAPVALATLNPNEYYSLVISEQAYGAVPDGESWSRTITIEAAYILQGFSGAYLNKTYDDETTVYVSQTVSPGASIPQTRKFNLIVQKHSNKPATNELPTNRADIIASSFMNDPYVGNMGSSEWDFTQMESQVNDIVAHFGDARLGEFCYTFDDLNTSIEEMVGVIANCVFCVAYRNNGKVSFSAELPRTQDGTSGLLNSTLLLSPANTLKGSESTEFRFGIEGGHDAVNLAWVDPDTKDSLVDYIATDLPDSNNVLTGQNIRIIGVRNLPQAYAHAWRIWNKKKYVKETYHASITTEAQVLVRNDLIEVATVGVNDLNADYQHRKVESRILKYDYDNARYEIYPPFPVNTGNSVDQAVEVTLMGSDGVPYQLSGLTNTDGITGGRGHLYPVGTWPAINLDDNAGSPPRVVMTAMNPGGIGPLVGSRTYRLEGMESEDGVVFKLSASQYTDLIYTNDSTLPS